MRPIACRRRALRPCSKGSTGTVSVDAVLAAFSEPAGEGPVVQRKAAIDRLFAGDMVENILAALDREAASGSGDAEWARKTAATIRTKSPLSLKLALAQVRRGKTWDFDDVHAHGVSHSVARHPWA